MRKELEEKLYEKYPVIFAEKDLPATESCMYWGIACGDGWYDIIDILCSNVMFYLKHNAKEKFVFTATQVKEKFGSLRFYYDDEQTGDEFVKGLVRMAEDITWIVCEECGNPGKRTLPGGWTRVLCAEHTKERDDKRAGK